MKATLSKIVAGREGRNYERVSLEVRGQLFDPVTDVTVECCIINLSPGGAGVKCGARFHAGANLVLHIDDFGRFEGEVVSHVANADSHEVHFGLAFSLSVAKRKRLADMISLFVRQGLNSVAELRKSPRIRTNGSVTMVLEDGQSIACELMDISLDGVALRTRERPPLGQFVSFGQTRGQVTRYHDQGIAIRFVRIGSSVAESIGPPTSSSREIPPA